MSRPVVVLLLLVVLSCAQHHGTDASAECIVGDLSHTPSITIATAPPDCCYGSWAGTISGTVNNVDTDLIKIVLYARTNVYWVQPLADSPNTYPACDGTWSNQTHGGNQYCAILCNRSWAPPSTLGYLPPIGGDILAIACSPSNVRTVTFGGYVWNVKSNGNVKVDPGPNYFSDSTENVWVDDQGRLHLRITQRNGEWYCPEVFSDQYFGNGTFRFTVVGAIDSLDPNVVAAGFVYADPAHEIDIEFSRWSVPGDPNGQYVIQPWDTEGNRHRFPFTLTGDTSTHSFIWSSASVHFLSWQGTPDGEGAVIQDWTYLGAGTPDPANLRMRFNVWLFNGTPPTDSQEVEIIISDFHWQAENPEPIRPSTWGMIKAGYR